MKKLGFGLMRLPLLNGEDQTSIDIAHVSKMADKFLEKGFTYFDTAACYHNEYSEIAFREAVSKRYPRERYTITDKLSQWMVKDGDFESFFAGQLERLGVDYVDYYLLHAVNKNGFAEAKASGAIDFMFKKKAEGKIGCVGFSFHDSADVLDMVLEEEPGMEIVQLQLNYLDWEDEGVQSRKCYEVARKHGKKVLVMEPVKGGALAKVPGEVKRMFKNADENMSVASWAIRFAASLEGVEYVLSGMSNEAQVDDNISYMEDFKKLNEEEKNMVLRGAEIIRGDISIGCTACRYCVEGCPMKIEIPQYFKAYNMIKTDGRDKATEVYNETAAKGGAPGECIKCGLCESICPQKLSIRDYLEDVSEQLG